MDDLLARLSLPDNQTRDAAEREFANMRQHRPLQLLGGLLESTTTAAVQARLLSAVLLRRLLAARGGLFDLMSPDLRAQTRAHLLQALANEPEHSIRLKLVYVVSSFANALMADTETWPELLPTTLAMSTSDDERARSTGLFLLGELCEDLGAAALAPLHAQIVPALFRNVSQPSKAQSVGVRAAARYLVCLEDPEQVASLGELVAPMLEAVATSLNQGDDEGALECVSAFEDMASSNPQFFRPHLAAVGQAMIQVSSARAVDQGVRRTSLEMLLTLAERAPGMVRRQAWLVQSVLDLAMGLICEVDDRTVEEWAVGKDAVTSYADFEEEDDTSQLGAVAVDRLVVALGGGTVFETAAAAAQAAMAAPEWQRRRGGLLAVSMMAAGVHDELEPTLPAVVARVGGFFSDPHPRVVYAAMIVVGELALEYAGTFQSQFLDALLEPLCGALGAQGVPPRTQAAACTAIANLFQPGAFDGALMESMGGRLVPVVTALGNVLSGFPGVPLQVLETATTALACVAQVGEAEMTPFYPSVVQVLRGILSNAQGPEFAGLRGRSVEALGLLGMAVGAEVFMSDAMALVPAMLSASPQSVMEGTYMMQTMARVANTLGEHFAPFLPQVLDRVLAALEADETEPDDADSAMLRELAQQRSADDEARTAVLFEKSAGLPIVYQLVRDMGPFMGADYLRRAAQAVAPLVTHELSAVRSPAAMAARQMVETGAELSPEAGAWCLETVMPPLVRALGRESNFENMLEQAEALAGCAFHAPGFPDELARSTLTLARNALLASRERSRRLFEEVLNDPEVDEYERLQADGQVENEKALCSHLVDVLSAVIKSGPAGVAATVEVVVPAVQAFVAPEEPERIRLVGLLMFIDLVEHGGAQGAQFQQPLLELMRREMANASDVSLMQGCVYGFGVLAQVGGDWFAPEAMAVAELLRQVVSSPQARANEDMCEVTDNAISALCNVALHCDVGGDVVGFALGQLPLRFDWQEAQTVHGRLLQWLQCEPFASKLAPHAAEVRRIFSELLQSSTCVDERQAEESLLPEPEGEVRGMMASFVG